MTCAAQSTKEERSMPSSDSVFSSRVRFVLLEFYRGKHEQVLLGHANAKKAIRIKQDVSSSKGFCH